MQPATWHHLCRQAPTQGYRGKVEARDFSQRDEVDMFLECVHHTRLICACMYIHIYIYVYVHIYIYIHMCMYIYIYIIYIYTVHVYIYIYIIIEIQVPMWNILLDMKWIGSCTQNVFFGSVGAWADANSSCPDFAIQHIQVCRRQLRRSPDVFWFMLPGDQKIPRALKWVCLKIVYP